MELLEKTRRVAVSDNLTVNTFAIKQNAKAFQILSSGLYSDKIKAIIRELSTNAKDSHTSAGKSNIPFDVFLPLQHDSRFYIRDYGTGISPEDIISIYTKYFESNKTHSNELVGCLGLGSKSPFAYTSNFVVTSYYEGTEYTYSVFVNAEGFPCITLMGEQDTSEDNGLKVEFLVKIQDISNFWDKAEDVYKWFDTTPNFVGHVLTVEKSEVNDKLPRGDDWYFARYHTGTTVLMGNVAYPVSLDDTTLTPGQKNLLRKPLVVTFGIGEVDIEASREGLSYDPRTIANIKKKLNEISRALQTLIEKKVSDAKCWWDACLILKENVDIFGDLNGLSKLEYDGKKLDGKCNLRKIAPDEWNLTWEHFYFRRYYGSIQRRSNEDFKPEDNVTFLYSDLTRGSIERVRKYLKDSGSSGSCVLVVEDKDKPSQLDEFIQRVGITKSHLINTSTLPAIQRAKVTRTKGVSEPVLRFLWSGAVVSSWYEDSNDPPDDAIYVPISNYHPLNKEGTEQCKDINTYSLQELSRNYQVLTGKELVIYGVKKSQLKKTLEENPNWVYLLDHLKNMQYIVDVPLYNYYRQMENDTGLLVGIYTEFYHFVNKHHNLGEIYEKAKNNLDLLKKSCYNKLTWNHTSAYQFFDRVLNGGSNKMPLPPNHQEIKQEFDKCKQDIDWLLTPIFRHCLNTQHQVDRLNREVFEEDLITNYLNKLS